MIFNLVKTQTKIFLIRFLIRFLIFGEFNLVFNSLFNLVFITLLFPARWSSGHVLLRTFREEPRYRNMSKDRAGTDSANTALSPVRSLDRIANASIETDHFGQRSIPF